MRVVIAPGASGTAATMAPYADGLRARGIAASTIDVPKRKAEEAVGAYVTASGSGPDVVIGGQSYGGRVASLLAADGEHTFAGLVLFSYPLHRPGGPEWELRSEHWPRLGCPVLFLSGDADPFARIDLLRHAIAERRPDARLVVYPGIGHGLTRVLDQALDEVTAFVRSLPG